MNKKCFQVVFGGGVFCFVREGVSVTKGYVAISGEEPGCVLSSSRLSGNFDVTIASCDT